MATKKHVATTDYDTWTGNTPQLAPLTFKSGFQVGREKHNGTQWTAWVEEVEPRDWDQNKQNLENRALGKELSRETWSRCGLPLYIQQYIHSKYEGRSPKWGNFWKDQREEYRSPTQGWQRILFPLSSLKNSNRIKNWTECTGRSWGWNSAPGQPHRSQKNQTILKKLSCLPEQM